MVFMNVRNAAVFTLAIVICCGGINVARTLQTSQDSNLRDIVGGAGLVGIRPKNPPVKQVRSQQKSGAKTTGSSAKRTQKTAPALSAEDQKEIYIADGNDARADFSPRYSEAVAQYKRALEIDPREARAYAGLGNVYLDQKRYAESAEAYEKAIGINPEYTDVYMPLGLDYIRLERYDAAIEAFKKVLILKPDQAEANNNLCYSLNHVERYQEAIPRCDEAIRLTQGGQPYESIFQRKDVVAAQAFKNLGHAYNGLERYKDAAEALEKAVRLEPENVSAHFNLGLAYYQLKRYSDAIAEYKLAIGLRPDFVEGHYNLGLTYVATGEMAAARSEYEALKPLNAALAEELARFLK